MLNLAGLARNTCLIQKKIPKKNKKFQIKLHLEALLIKNRIKSRYGTRIWIREVSHNFKQKDLLGTYSNSPMMFGGTLADNPNDIDVWDIEVDPADNIIFCGQVFGTGHLWQPSPGTSMEGFVYKLDPSGKIQIKFNN